MIPCTHINYLICEYDRHTKLLEIAEPPFMHLFILLHFIAGTDMARRQFLTPHPP